MTHPEPVVTNSGVPEVEQEFDADVARHLARLEADRPVTPAEERTGGHDGPLPHISPPYCGTCSPYGGSDPVTPAEARTGVSDVQHAIADEVAALRAEITIGWWEVDEPGRDQALARLDRIEMWARGGQR